MNHLQLLFCLLASICIVSTNAGVSRMKSGMQHMSLEGHMESLKKSSEVSISPNAPSYFSNMTETFDFSDGNSGTEVSLSEARSEETEEGKFITRIFSVTNITGYESFNYEYINTLEFVQEVFVQGDGSVLFEVIGIGTFVEEIFDQDSLIVGNVSITGAGSMVRFNETTTSLLSENSLVFKFVDPETSEYRTRITTNAMTFDVFEDVGNQRIYYDGYVNMKTVNLDDWTTKEVETLYTKHVSEAPAGDEGPTSQTATGISRETAGECLYTSEGEGYDWVVEGSSKASNVHSSIQRLAVKNSLRFSLGKH